MASLTPQWAGRPRRNGIAAATALLLAGGYVGFRSRSPADLPTRVALTPSSAQPQPQPPVAVAPSRPTIPAVLNLAGQAAGGAAAGAEPKRPGERVASEPGPQRPPDARDQDPGPGPYLEHYQGRSGRLSPHAVASSEPVSTKVASMAKGPELVAWSTRYRVNEGEQALVRATLVDSSGHPVIPSHIEVRIAPRSALADETRAPMPASTAAESHFEFAFDTSGGRARRTTDAPAGEPPAIYDFVVHAAGTLDGAPYDRMVAGSFVVQHAGASLLAPTARLAQQRGNLELAIALHVDQPGNYYVEAQVWGGPEGQIPIAFARDRFKGLVPGQQQLTLVFGGEVIHDSGVDGPYVVRNVQLSRVSSLPPHQAEPITELPRTPPFRSSEFY